jgi:ketosteroid isomerase-like protein
MNEKSQIQDCYKAMYAAMIAKDRKGLEEVLDDSFVLVHMTGMRQNKEEFITAVLDGTLNYYSAVHENMPVETGGDNAVITGQSYVQAAVFGGGKSYWHLQQKCSLKKINYQWIITRSVASTY